MSLIFFLVFIINFVAIRPVLAQVPEGVPCETPNQEYGLCINIYNCSELMNLLITKSNNPQTRTFLRSSTCGFVKNTPLVCCPQSKTENNVNPIFTSSTTETPNSRTPRTNINNNNDNNNNNYSKLPRRPNCGHGNYSNPRVVNGIPAKLGEFPWIVALGYRNSKNPEVPKWLCGGTLITNRHILTAAHCVYNRPDLFTARVGDLDLYSDEDGAKAETIPLSRAKIHEEFSGVTYTNDIAILTLSRPAQKSTAWPICLPIEDNLRNNDFATSRPTVAGWGSIYFNGPSSPTLLEVVLPIVDLKTCKNAYGSRSVIDSRVLCAGYLTGGKDACQGDSGGPLMHRTMTDNSEIWFYQIGVVSYGLRCAEAGYPGVYTRVTAFLDWIQRNVD